MKEIELYIACLNPRIFKIKKNVPRNHFLRKKNKYFKSPMKIQNFYIFVYSFLFFHLRAKNSEKLEIFGLGHGKNLLHFSFDFEENLKLDNIFFETNVWSRSVFEELLLDAGINKMRVEMSNGRINPYFEHLGFDFEIPNAGTKVFLNPEANYGNAINALAEIFTFERKTLLKQNNFKIVAPDNVGNCYLKGVPLRNFIFGQSPDDFLCVETFEKIREYLGCYGSKGLFSLLEFNKIMKSDYVSLVGYLEFNELLNVVKYGIEINIIVDFENKEEYFQTRNLLMCGSYHEARIVSFDENKEKLSETINFSEEKMVPFKDIPFINLRKQANYSENSKPIKVEKFISQPVFSFENDIIYQIENKDRPIKVVIFEYLPYYFSPKFHHISGYLNQNQAEINFTVETIDIGDKVKTMILKFLIEIPARSTYSLKIPVKKLMKSFENYPHDAARGHPLIGTPILYFYPDSPFYNITYASNLLMRIPEPDFSMPFNISTYTLVLLGYFYLMIFKIAMGKAYQHWTLPEQKSILSRILSCFKK